MKFHSPLKDKGELVRGLVEDKFSRDEISDKTGFCLLTNNINGKVVLGHIVCSKCNFILAHDVSKTYFQKRKELKGDDSIKIRSAGGYWWRYFYIEVCLKHK